MAKILLIDDSVDIGVLVEHGLNSYMTFQAYSLAEAEEMLKRPDFALILIDVGLPDGNGFDFCQRLMQHPLYMKTPKILLTAMDQASEKVYGFNCGADDYVTKPFNPIELKARVDRYLQRKLTNFGVEVHGHFEFNLEFQRCTRLEGGQRVEMDLTPTEFRLFLTLIKSAGRVLSRKTLEQVGWEGSVIELRGIDTHIAHLRKKLGPFRKQLVSVYGQGYSFSLDQVKKAA
ncbi:MAG: response regulator transcription factor [Bdellovibrionales bacterium]|nr:response regulator transcription factor [Bdellovibrionales bacterium]